MDFSLMSASPSQKGVNVLLFEDDALTLSRIHELLVECDAQEYRLDRVSTYTDAVRILKSNPYDVCVIDSVIMGERACLAEALRADYFVPFIIVTSASVGEVLEAIYQGAADCLLRDQLSAELLKQSICRVIGRWQALSRRINNGKYPASRDAGIRSEAERQVILDIIQSVIVTPNLDELLKLIHEALKKVLYADNCFVALHDKQTGLFNRPFYVDQVSINSPPERLKKSCTAYVYRTGRPLLMTQEIFQKLLAADEVELVGTPSPSWLGVPLKTPAETIGVLVVQHYEDENAYSKDDLEFLSSVAGQIALAIERKRVEEALQDANRRAITEYKSLVERIAALGQSLGHARDLTLIFRALRDFSVLSVPCDGLVISLYDQQKAQRRAVFLWTDETEFEPDAIQHIPVGDGLVGQAIKSGSTIIDNNLQENVTSRTVAIGNCEDDKMPRSAIYSSMTIMGRTIGCIEVQSYQVGAYTQEHVTAMQMAANLAANAIENVHLLEREREKEQQLLQSQKMEAVGQLAGGVAHDFNNLLTAITGYSELALKRIEDDDPVRRNIEEIRKAGSRAASLTRQLLAFSRKQMLQAKILDLNSIVADMDKMLQRLIGEDIDFVTVLKPSIGRIKGDPGQIEQVLINLVVNARDAMPRGGKLTVETGQLYLDETYAERHQSVPSGHYIMLAVTDTGLGMNADTQKRIFEPFFTTKALGKGTGLGLSTVYGIIKQSGGHIWVYSEPGKGTTFKIYLPRVEEMVGVVDESPEEGRRGSETVVLVEDEEMVRELAREILQSSGYKVIVAANGEEAQRICSEGFRKIDLIITDVVMPQMSGRELAENISLLRPDTRILYMSGYTDDAIVRHGVLDDNMFFLQKPFTPDALTTKVREVLESVPA